ncbi:hypothetical protein [Nitrospira sp. M1]
MNRDFVEMLFAFNETGADFMIVGAHAVAAHGEPRATGDLDIWVRSTADNADRVFNALKQFGAPLANLYERSFPAKYCISNWGCSFAN